MKKIIFLILALLLIGGGVFLIFFRKDPTSINNVNDKFLGKFEHTIEWQKNGTKVRDSYAYIEFDDGEWYYYGYSIIKGKKESEISMDGTYRIDKKDNTLLYANYEDDEGAYYLIFYLDGDKLCQTKKGCNNYFVKTSSDLNSHLTLEEITD